MRTGKVLLVMVAVLAMAGAAGAQCIPADPPGGETAEYVPCEGNLIVNGDFEETDGTLLGFTSGYRPYLQLNPTDSGFSVPGTCLQATGCSNDNMWCEGVWVIGRNPANYHRLWYNNYKVDGIGVGDFGDHTNNRGNMLILNGATTPGTVVWSQTVSGIIPNTMYTFSFWARSAYIDAPPILTVKANGQDLALDPFTPVARQWQKVTYQWQSGDATQVTFEIANSVTAASGNDYAIDDIELCFNGTACGTPLIAGGGGGGGETVGSVITEETTPGMWKVTYSTTDPWELTELHLHMACDAENLPQNKGGNPQIGHFAYTAYPEPGTQTFVFPDDVDGLDAVVPLCGEFKTGFYPCPGFCTCPYVAAHAVVANTGYCQAFATVYGVERKSGDLYEIDVVGGIATKIGETGDPAPSNDNSPNGLAWDPTTGRLYFSANAQEGDATSDLYYWSGSTAVSAGTVPGQVAGATFFEGEYYYIKNANDDLVKVQFNSDGAVEAVVDVFPDFTGNIDSFRFGDIVIYPETEGWTLYGSSLASTKTNTPPTFFSISSDGTYTEISTTDGTGLQLAIGSDGVLYGQSTGNGEFFTIVPATGATTSVGVPAGALDGFTDTASGTRCVPPTETAWGFGEGFAGSSWAMYFNPCVCLQPEPSVE